MKSNEIHIYPQTEGEFFRRRLKRLKKENRNRIFLISVICALEFVLILAICGICNKHIKLGSLNGSLNNLTEVSPNELV